MTQNGWAILKVFWMETKTAFHSRSTDYGTAEPLQLVRKLSFHRPS